MKKLVEKRNAQFCDAVNELLRQFVNPSPLDPPQRNGLLVRTPKSKDPVSLLQESGRGFVPVNTAWNGDVSNDPSEIPSSEERLSATEVIEVIQKQNWYKDQIGFRQETEEKTARPGSGRLVRSPTLALYTWTQEPLRHRYRRPLRLLCPLRGRYPPFIVTKQRQ